MSLDLAAALVTSAVTMAIPLLFAALGELIAERSHTSPFRCSTRFR